MAAAPISMNPCLSVLAVSGDVTFASGWAPLGTAKIMLTFTGGEIVETTAFETLDGYDASFFVMSLVPAPDGEPEFPLVSEAFDAADSTLATATSTES